MVVAIATLAGFGLVIADVAGLALLRSYLTSRLDRQLTAAATGFAHIPGGSPPPRFGPRPDYLRSPETDVWVAIYDATGTRLDPGEAGAGPALTYQDVRAHVDDGPYTVDRRRGAWRVVVTQRGSGSQTLVAALSLRQVTATADRLLAIDVAVSMLVLLVLGSAAAYVVRAGLSPLTRMESTAQQIADGDLSQRVTDVDPHTEAGRLGLALNAMLGRIQSALHDRAASELRLRQFLADASHELRTPLTSIQGFAELYQRGGVRPGAQLDEAMGRIEAEAARMAVLVGDLLLLARLDEERPMERVEVDLFTVAADAIRDARARAPRRTVRLEELATAAPESGPPAVFGDEARLHQVATNLVTNALVHTPATARIVVRVGRATAGQLDDQGPEPVSVGAAPARDAPLAVLEVVDDGPGMAPEQAAGAFERLFRADPSRQRGTDGVGGAGLGLSIVAAIVTAHGGRVELRTIPGGVGTSFRVLLPAIVPSDDAAITEREILDVQADVSLARQPTGTP
jgi:two-component system, OmpR family, sensor kinase